MIITQTSLYCYVYINCLGINVILELKVVRAINAFNHFFSQAKR